MPELYGTLSATGVLNGTLQTIVYADNYNNLTNKPAINGHTLQGDQTASDLGLLTLADVPVESVNGQTGTVVLDGADIPYSAGLSVNDKIDAVEDLIPSVPVLSVNGQTGTVVLDGADIEYGAGVSVNDQIDNVAAQIPSIPVESVNGQTGVVDLDGNDINYNASTTINQRLDILYNAIPDVPVQSVNAKIGNVVLDGSDIAYNASYTVNGRIDYVEGLIEAGNVVSVNGHTGVVVLEGSDIEYSAGVTVNDQIGSNATAIGNISADVGNLSNLTTTVQSSLVGAVNSLATPEDITNDYITMATGYTFTSGKVYKQGKHIFGNIVLSGTLQGGNNSDTLGTIKSDYRTSDPINGFCGISNGQWFTNNIGYVYIASSGGLQVATTPTGMNYAKIHIDYVTA